MEKRTFVYKFLCLLKEKRENSKEKGAKRTTGVVCRCEVKFVGDIIFYRLFAKYDLILITTCWFSVMKVRKQFNIFVLSHYLFLLPSEKSCRNLNCEINASDVKSDNLLKFRA